MMAAAAAAERCGRDPCGALCPLLAYLSVGYADYAVLAHVLPQPALRASPWCPIHAVTFNLLVLLLLASHTRAVFADPGVVPLPGTAIDFSDLHPTERNSDEWTLCSRCEAYRPPRAHHCRVCHRCVRRMDHHCPWINNCIGELNQKYFIQFLFYTGLTSAYAAGLVLAVWLGPSGGDGTENRIQTWCPSSRSNPTSGGQRRRVGDEHGQQHCRRCLGEAVCSAGSAPAAPHPTPHTASCPTATSEPHRMAGGGDWCPRGC
ncbi:palmitoyltransferase ZDHHC3-like isoform X2 [Phasianus colchicus]|uniref:palmitoyltransferase ZDHHC3-like isoform X2 n=1 Tax=Phasianus colchicus TaxID=9054 RepID=UPI00129D49F1|nr:palmitoyltransferase ZDHHC3-like isoform X2 [Phasianus colchicus]